MRKILLISVTLIMILYITPAFVLGHIHGNPYVNKETQTTLAPIEPDNATQGPEKQYMGTRLETLSKQITTLLLDQPGTYGFSMYIERNADGRVVPFCTGYNQGEVFKMGSTFKVPLNLYLYQQVEDGNISLDDKLVYEPDFYEEGTGSLQYVKPGDSYPVSQLAQLSIRESDNVATNMLVNKLDRDHVLAYMASLGAKAKSTDDTNYATPDDLVIYMKEVLIFANDNPALGSVLLKDLENTVFYERIAAGVPEGVTIAHKIGSLDSDVNDMAIVFAPSGKYVLTIMSRDVNEETANGVEDQVSRMVWDAVQDLSVPEGM